MRNKIMFICPFWNQKDHVGTIRAERLVHWMNKIGIEVIVVAAGHGYFSQKTDYGELVVIQDPLRIYPDIFNQNKIAANAVAQRKPNKFRRWFAYFILVPDLHIMWSKSVIKSKEVKIRASDCDLFMASSPPESSFHAASKLSDKYGGKFIMDMRDGWLDEPMKPLLKSLWIQRTREKRVEKNILKKAVTVWVTSDNWKKLLSKRYPDQNPKIHVLPNCYPKLDLMQSESLSNSKDKHLYQNIQLLHAGKISSSRPERNIENLLEIILQHIDSKGIKINITFLGTLDNLETTLIQKWDRLFQNHHSRLQIKQSVSRTEALKIMKDADGLLMISNSFASIPAKYYDYSVTGKPVLNYTIENSASQNASNPQSQFYNLIESKISGSTLSDKNSDVLKSFFEHCIRGKSSETKLNPIFTEDHVFNQFKSIVEELIHD